MRILITLIFIAQIFAQNLLDIEIDSTTGDYTLVVKGTPWLKSAPTALHYGNKWYSSADKTLSLSSVSNSTGSDKLGAYKETTLNWMAGSYKWATSIKTYSPSSFIIFTQSFSTELTETSIGNNNDVLSAFPTFQLTTTPLHYLSYYGTFADPRTGKWGPGTSYPFGLQGGSPLALFDNNLLTLVISPADDFMSSIQSLSKSLGGAFACGIQGKIASVPAGFSHSTIIAADVGVNNAFNYWGSTLLKLYGKKPKTVNDDYSIKYLGYWTDNGAYYYYNTEQNKNYAESMIDVYNYIETQTKLPIQYYQFDSWWYLKGNTQGLLLWEPRTDIFPNGMKDLMSKMGNKPLVLHNRWFENDTYYHTKMNYPFAVEPGFALPLTEEPYDYFMSKAKDWGLIVYEQDWLVTQFTSMQITQTDIHVAENWMLIMNKAAQKLDITIQLCMPLPCHILQTLNMSQVTQIRASGDYQRQVYDKDQWAIGYTSLLHDALGVFPFKDCFWSNNTEQPNCGTQKVCVEPNALLETIVSLISAGPVAPADKIGYLSTENLMQTCRTDGVLLKPDGPARTMDLVFSEGFKGSPTLWNLISATSSHKLQNGNNAKLNWHYILAANTQHQFTITPADLGEADSANMFAFDYFAQPVNLVRFGNDYPLIIPALNPNGDIVTFKYFVVFQATSSYSLVGEKNKFAVASNQRFGDITQQTSSGQTVTQIPIMGDKAESVTVTMLHTPTRSLENYTCTLSATGTATLKCTDATTHTCTCS